MNVRSVDAELSSPESSSKRPEPDREPESEPELEAEPEPKLESESEPDEETESSLLSGVSMIVELPRRFCWKASMLVGESNSVCMSEEMR